MSEAHRELSAFVARVRRRWLTCVLLRTAGIAALSASLPVAAAVLCERLFHPEGRTLVLLAVLTLGFATASAAWAVSRMQRRPGDVRVARFIEERLALDPAVGSLDDAVVTAVSAASDPADQAAPLGAALAAVAVRRLRGLSPGSIVSAAALRRSAAVAAAGVVVLAGVSWPAVPSLVAAAESAWLAWSPESIRIEVVPGDVRVPAGRAVTIRAAVRAGSRVLTRLQPSVVVSAAGQVRAIPMSGQGGDFELSFESVDRTFTYRVAAGPVTSREFTVSALVPPQVKRVEAHYEYPSFTGLPPRDDENAGDLYAPAGTRVRLRVHTDRPVASGTMSMSNGAASTSLRKTAATRLEADLLLTRDDAYRLRISDAEGLRGGGETEYFIRLMDDRPPGVRIVRPGGDQPITPLQEVTIEARADDDHGIAAFDLTYSVAGRAERTMPFSRVSGTNVDRVGAYVLSAEDLQVQPGDVITYYARARDIGRGKRPTETRSDMFFLEVRPFNEEFVSAESQAMSGSGDPQIEGLIAAQKNIISATWRIERRAGAGRSATDVKSVSQAQRELQARAEQMTRGGRSAPAQQLPQQVGQFGQRRVRSAGAEAVASAAQAMGLAVKQLDVEKTKEAIPHEMAALHGLMQAQAEVRRRQVAQQARGASGNGYGRQGQDLSALFDRELQRQQRTNYETRSSAMDRPDAGQDNTALDRIRDLARRQEELNDRQRELAQKQSTPEQRKRRLEELTREQEALRERAESVSRQLDQGRGGAGAGAREMREAAGQMRSAATELQRQDPSAAAARSTRAAEQLRQVEERLRAGTASAGEPGGADLRLEAQQIVEAQRRIAGEAARLATGGAGAPDVRRRLAAEKTALADRVDALERAALARAGQGPAAGDTARAASETAAELRRQQVSERMRSSAGDMQAERGTGREQAGTEREITRALDAAVARLGTGSRGDAHSLSRQLEEARAIRERLDRIETQLRDADARVRDGQGGGAPPGTARAGGEGMPSNARGGEGSARSGSGAGGERERLGQEYARELARAREALDALAGAQPRGGQAGATPEEHVFSQSAPGNEAFKQDFTRWESLRKGIDVALERHESSLARRLGKQLAQDRLSAGGSERGADGYARLIARYYESLARTKQ